MSAVVLPFRPRTADRGPQAREAVERIGCGGDVVVEHEPGAKLCVVRFRGRVVRTIRYAQDREACGNDVGAAVVAAVAYAHGWADACCEGEREELA